MAPPATEGIVTGPKVVCKMTFITSTREFNRDRCPRFSWTGERYRYQGRSSIQSWRVTRNLLVEELVVRNG